MPTAGFRLTGIYVLDDDADYIKNLRERIKVGRTLDKLQACVDGTEKMRPEQIKAADILLKKVMPDLKAVEHTGDARPALTREQLIERLTKLHSRAATATDDAGATGAGNGTGADTLQH